MVYLIYKSCYFEYIRVKVKTGSHKKGFSKWTCDRPEAERNVKGNEKSLELNYKLKTTYHTKKYF